MGDVPTPREYAAGELHFLQNKELMIRIKDRDFFFNDFKACFLEFSSNFSNGESFPSYLPVMFTFFGHI